MVMMKVVTVSKVVPPPPGQRQHRSPAGASRSQSVLSSPPRSEGWSRTGTHTRNTHTISELLYCEICHSVWCVLLCCVTSCCCPSCYLLLYWCYFAGRFLCRCFYFLTLDLLEPTEVNLFDVSRMLCCTVSCGFLLFQVRSCRCVCSLLGSRPLTLSEQLTLAPFCRSSFTMSACPRPAAQMIGYTLYCCEGHRRTCQRHH